MSLCLLCCCLHYFVTLSLFHGKLFGLFSAVLCVLLLVINTGVSIVHFYLCSPTSVYGLLMFWQNRKPYLLNFSDIFMQEMSKIKLRV